MLPLHDTHAQGASGGAYKRTAVYQFASCAFVRERLDILLLTPPGLGKSDIAQSFKHAAIRAGLDVLYRSIFDLARELQSECSPAELDLDRATERHLKAGLFIIDYFGMKALPAKAG